MILTSPNVQIERKIVEKNCRKIVLHQTNKGIQRDCLAVGSCWDLWACRTLKSKSLNFTMLFSHLPSKKGDDGDNLTLFSQPPWKVLCGIREWLTQGYLVSFIPKSGFRFGFSQSSSKTHTTVLERKRNREGRELPYWPLPQQNWYIQEKELLGYKAKSIALVWKIWNHICILPAGFCQACTSAEGNGLMEEVHPSGNGHVSFKRYKSQNVELPIFWFSNMMRDIQRNMQRTCNSQDYLRNAFQLIMVQLAHCPDSLACSSKNWVGGKGRLAWVGHWADSAGASLTWKGVCFFLWLSLQDLKLSWAAWAVWQKQTSLGSANQNCPIWPFALARLTFSQFTCTLDSGSLLHSFPYDNVGRSCIQLPVWGVHQL